MLFLMDYLMNKKINYQKKLDDLLEGISAEGRRPTLLLHACCGPCSSYVLEYLSEAFDITLLYDNPNISPREEYDKRAAEADRLIREMGVPVRLQVAPWEPEAYLAAVRGLESEPEGMAYADAARMRQVWADLQHVMEGDVATLSAE